MEKDRLQGGGDVHRTFMKALLIAGVEERLVSVGTGGGILTITWGETARHVPGIRETLNAAKDMRLVEAFFDGLLSM